MKRTQITQSAIATAIGITIGATATNLPAHDPAPVVVEQQATARVSGTIRWQSPTTWAPIHDAGHEPVGIKDVQVLRDRLRVRYDFTAAKVVELQVTPDESFTAANVRCGASVGLSYTDVFCYMPGKSTPVDPSLLTRKGGNIWLSGEFDL